MDILFRLRLLLWVLVIGLWGTLAYQFLAEDDLLPRMSWIAQYAPSLPGATPPPPKERDLRSALPPFPPPHRRAPPSPRTALRPEALKPPPPPSRPRAAPPIEEPRPAEPRPAPETERLFSSDFVKSRTRHFIVYAEQRPPSPDLLDALERLHGNIMLDLVAFSPWARDERVTIYLFRSQESYRRATGRPPWSGGASSVKRRKIYVYDSEELVGILAHELCHIYFDGFFISGGSPLWLSEGMATLIQTERGLSAPNWLKPNLDLLRGGHGYSVEDMLVVEDTTSARDEDIRLWYAQAYSVVRFLMRSQYRSSFYKFCRHLRDGASPEESLYRAYGMPFNRLKALEYAWRHDLEARH